MAGRRFCGAYCNSAVTTEYRLDRLQFAEVAHGGRSRMRVEMLDVARREPDLPERRRHGAGRSFAVFRSRSHVVGIRRGAIADQFRNGVSAPRLRMLQC